MNPDDEREWERQQALREARELRMRQAKARPYVRPEDPTRVPGVVYSETGGRCPVCRNTYPVGTRIRRSARGWKHYPECRPYGGPGV